MAYVVPSVLYLVWVTQVPLQLVPYSAHDDALFWTLAEHITGGRWLGPYNNLTLAKGPGWPLVIAVNHWVGTPISVLLALLHVAGCAALARSLARVGLHRYLALVLFLVILFHPAVVPLRLLRDPVYVSLTLLAVAGALRVVASRDRGPTSFGVTGGLGAALGLFWVTREEGIWIVPGVIVLLVLAALSVWRQRDVMTTRLMHAGAYVGSAVVVVSLVALTNQVVYGRFIVTDFKDGSFTAAVDALNGVEVGEQIAFVPVTQREREAVYAVSPAFRELRDNLDVRENTWKTFGCDVYPHACGDYKGGWWVWAFRDAVAERGYYESPDKAAEFYDRLAREVGHACAAGDLTCRSSPVPFMPHVTDEQVGRMPNAVRRALDLLLLRDEVGTPVLSTEASAERDRVRDYLGGPVSMPAASELSGTVTGWYTPPDQGWPDVVCMQDTGEAVRSPLPRDPGAGAADHRFSLSIPEASTCWLSATPDSPEQLTFSTLIATPSGTDLPLGGGSLHVESVVSRGGPTSWPIDLLTALGRLYRNPLVLITGAGALVMCAAAAASVLRRRHRSALLVVALALWILTATRVAVLVLVDTSAFPAIHPYYLGPAFPLLIAASIVSLQLLSPFLRPQASHPASDSGASAPAPGGAGEASR